MKLNLKNVFLSFGIFVLAFVMFAGKADATAIATATAGAGGAWTDTATWEGGVVPQASDTVTILAGDTVTIGAGDSIAAITSLTIASTGVLENAATSAVVIPTVVVTGTLTNTGVMTVGTAISGEGLITNTGTLNIGGTSVIDGTLTTNAPGATVNYTGSGQTCKNVAYANLVVSGGIGFVCPITSAINVTTSGTVTWSTSSNLTLTGTLTVGSGTTVTSTGGGFALVAPTAVINGTLINAGTTTIATSLTGTGTVTNNATGILNIGQATVPTLTTLTATETGNVVNYTSAAPNCKVTAYDTLGFSGSGAVTCAVTTVTDEIILSGTVTWTTTSSITTAILTIGSGTSMTNAAAYTLTAPTTVVTGALANAGTTTIATSLTGAGALTNTGTLNLGGATTSAAGVTTLTATATGNTVNYNKSGAQTVKATTYYDLNLSGSGLKTIANTAAVSNYLSMITGVSALIANGQAATAYAFRFDGSWKATGTWAYSGATNNNTTYFNSSSTGTLTVAHRPSVSVAVPIITTGGQTTSTVAQSTEPVTIQITAEVTETTTTPGCSGGNKYNTSTGALCQNTVVATAKATYDFGTKTLKNGSKGEAVMELQRFLNAKLNLGLAVDGKLGPKTIAVVKKWQKDNNLVADGLIGAKTKAKMNAEAN